DAEPPRSLGAASKTTVVSGATHAVMPIPVNTRPGRSPSEYSGLAADNPDSASPEAVTRQHRSAADAQRKTCGCAGADGHDGGDRQECSPRCGSGVAVRVNQQEWQEEQRAGSATRTAPHTVIAFAATKRRSAKRRDGATGWRARLSRHTNRAPSGAQ